MSGPHPRVFLPDDSARPSLSYVAVLWRRNPRGFTYISEEVFMLSMSEAAKAAGVASYRIKYALETRKLPEPGRVGGRRFFTSEDVERVRQHFAAMDTPAGVRQPRGRGKEAS